ncbi:MAG: hypothetical protein ABI467_10125 [Kofleriaceae bacterium]
MRTFLAAIVVCVSTNLASAGPTDPFAASLVLDANHVAAALTFEANLAPAQLASPASIAPDLWYGITPELTVGVIHSDASIDRVPVFFEPGGTICVRLERVSCPRHYHGSGLDGLYELVRGDLGIALHARLLLRDVAPIKPAITAGVTMRWRIERWLVVVGDPFVQLGLWNVDAGNRAELWLPITLAVAPLARWSLEVHTGYNTDLAVWNDGFYVPVLVRVRAHVTDHVDAGVAAGFASLVGTQNSSRERMAAVDVTWRN